jgi:hypothetical protein
MAQLKGAPVSGAVGDVVFRRVNNKTIICARPQKFTVSMLPAAVNARKHFAACSRMRAALMHNPLLRMVWEFPREKNLSLQGKFFRSAVNGLTNDYSFSNLEIAPIKFLAVSADSTLNKDALVVKVYPNPSIILPYDGDSVMLQGVLYLYNPGAEVKKMFRVLPIQSERVTWSKNAESMVFEIPFGCNADIKGNAFPIHEAITALCVIPGGTRMPNYSNSFFIRQQY